MEKHYFSTLPRTVIHYSEKSFLLGLKPSTVLKLGFSKFYSRRLVENKGFQWFLAVLLLL